MKSPRVSDDGEAGFLIPKHRRVRDAKHLAYVRRQPCAVPGCRGRHVHAHHLTFGPDPKARGLKAADRHVIPVCWEHHAELHLVGKESGFWAFYNVDAVGLAARLWAESHAGEMP